MTDFVLKQKDGFQFGLRPDIEGIDLNYLLVLMRQPFKSMHGGLEGRSSVIYAELPVLGSVVIKPYMRGGLLGRINRNLYLGQGKSRSEIEFELVEQVRALGINAPEPLLWARRGGIIYRTWLVTREIERKSSLSELSQRDDDAAREVMEELIRQLAILIKNSIYHVDLHPGNVLVDDSGRVYLVDFDKACFFKGSRRDLRDRYIFRWRRAAIKHRLPEFLSEMMCLGLRRVE